MKSNTSLFAANGNSGVRSKETGKSVVWNERNDFELEKSGFHKRQRGQNGSSFFRIFAFKDEDGFVPILAEVQFTDDPRLVQLPRAQCFGLEEFGSESVISDAWDFFFKREDLHGVMVRRVEGVGTRYHRFCSANSRNRTGNGKKTDMVIG